MNLIKMNILLLSIAVSSCALNKSTLKIQSYKGSELNLKEIGILKCERFIQINSIDGNSEYSVKASHGKSFQDCEIGLLPGKHSISLCYDLTYNGDVLVDWSAFNGLVSCDPRIIELDVEAGRIYRINTQITKNYSKNLFGTRNHVEIVAGKITITDQTEREKLAVYYSLAKEQSVLAKKAQRNNEWRKAKGYWLKTLEYAEQGEIGLDKIAKIQLRYGMALATVCEYDEAIDNLKKSYDFYNEYTGHAYKPLIPMANIYFLKNKCGQSLEIYYKVLSEFEAKLEKDDDELFEHVKSNIQIIKNNKKCNELHNKKALYYQVPLGKRC